MFAEDQQIAYASDDSPERLDVALERRLLDSLEHFHAALARRHRPHDRNLLATARWSV
ncbi:NAD(P)H-dependent FMN reductase [compost metagenome]